MPKACSFVVVSVSIAGENEVQSVLREIASSSTLIVQEHAMRRPGDIASEYLESDEDQARVLLSCSLEGQHDEDEILGILSSLFPKRLASLWMTSPCCVPLFSGTLEDLYIQRHSIEEDALTIMHKNGLGFMKDAIPLTIVEAVLQIAETRIQDIEAKIRTGHPNIRLGVDLFALQEVASRGIHRYDVLFDEEDPRSSLIFELSRSATWFKYIQKILGTSELHILASVVYSDPGSEDQEWHSDGPHQGQDCYGVCVFLPLIDLDATVGFTQFYPRSHRHQALLGMGGASLATGSALDAIFSRGDAILYDYRTIHRGIGNRSIATRRPLLQLVYHTNSYKESRNYGKEKLLS